MIENCFTDVEFLKRFSIIQRSTMICDSFDGTLWRKYYFDYFKQYDRSNWQRDHKVAFLDGSIEFLTRPSRLLVSIGEKYFAFGVFLINGEQNIDRMVRAIIFASSMDDYYHICVMLKLGVPCV